MNTVLDILLIALAVVIGYRYGQRHTSRYERHKAWAAGFETGAQAMAVAIADDHNMPAVADEIVISAAHRDEQIKAARKGLQ